MQSRPAQQSPTELHAAPLPWQAHVPLWHCMAPQQSWLVVHPSDWAAQHCIEPPPWTAPQRRVPQQAPELVQASPACEHWDVEVHVPDVQASPPLHAVPLQQGCPEAPHAGWHCPALQTKPAWQALPVQHDCPEPPQVVLGV